MESGMNESAGPVREPALDCGAVIGDAEGVYGADHADDASGKECKESDGHDVGKIDHAAAFGCLLLLRKTAHSTSGRSSSQRTPVAFSISGQYWQARYHAHAS